MTDLETRVRQFQALELPGQPRGMHMGTSYLVSDLWREVQRLRAAPAQCDADTREVLERADIYLRNVPNRSDAGVHHVVSDLAAALRAAVISEAREKQISRLATIEECAQLVEKTSLRNPDNIARDIRALSELKR